MLRKIKIIFLLIFFLLINNYLLAEKSIYFFPKLEGRENWQKEIHYFSSENQVIDLSFKAYSKNKFYHPPPIKIPLSFYKKGIFSLKEIYSDNVIENISYLREETRQEKIIAFEVVKSSEKNKIEIISPNGIENSHFRSPIFFPDSYKYKNFIILNENAYSVKSKINILNQRKNEIIFSRVIKLAPSSSRYLQINELIKLNEYNISKGPVSVEILSDDKIKIFPVFGFYQNRKIIKQLDNEPNDFSIYFPTIEVNNEQIWSIILLYNNQNMPVNFEVETFDSFGNSAGVFYSETIQPNKIYYLKSFDLDRGFLFNSFSYIKVNTDKNIINCLIYGKENETSVYIIKPFSYQNNLSNSINKSEIYSGSNSGNWVWEDNSRAFGLLEGNVSNEVKNGNKIIADLNINSFLSIWLEETGSHCMEGSEVKPSQGDFLNNKLSKSWIQLINPDGTITYEGEFTGPNAIS